MPCCFSFPITLAFFSQLCLVPPLRRPGSALDTLRDLTESSCTWPYSCLFLALFSRSWGLSLTATPTQNQGPSSGSLIQGQTYWGSLSAGFLAHGTSLPLLLQQGGNPSCVRSVKSRYRGRHYEVIPPKLQFPKDEKLCHSESLETPDDAEEGRELWDSIPGSTESGCGQLG